MSLTKQDENLLRGFIGNRFDEGISNGESLKKIFQDLSEEFRMDVCEMMDLTVELGLGVVPKEWMISQGESDPDLAWGEDSEDDQDGDDEVDYQDHIFSFVPKDVEWDWEMPKEIQKMVCRSLNDAIKSGYHERKEGISADQLAEMGISLELGKGSRLTEVQILSLLPYADLKATCLASKALMSRCQLPELWEERTKIWFPNFYDIRPKNIPWAVWYRGLEALGFLGVKANLSDARQYSDAQQLAFYRRRPDVLKDRAESGDIEAIEVLLSLLNLRPLFRKRSGTGTRGTGTKGTGTRVMRKDAQRYLLWQPAGPHRLKILQWLYDSEEWLLPQEDFYEHILINFQRGARTKRVRNELIKMISWMIDQNPKLYLPDIKKVKELATRYVDKYTGKPWFSRKELLDLLGTALMQSKTGRDFRARVRRIDPKAQVKIDKTNVVSLYFDPNLAE